MKQYFGFLTLAALLGGTTASAITIIDIRGIPVTAGETLIIDADGDVVQEITRTGITIESMEDGFVEVQFIPGPVGQKEDEVADDFLLLDGTLRVSSTIPAGQQRIRVRMGYERAGLRRAGLRTSSVRLLRRRALGRTARWLPAVQAATGRAGVRFARTSPLQTERRVGFYGFDADTEFVWAILDRNSDYAVGAQLVAEPASLVLLAGGLGALFASCRYRRHL